ncbi:uncharacterized protein [Salminus brasiliensis]|uniref:uncharacterized protein n=1 Tax=Salminus brasiliensis TaxID=930266 RepID=UPI003B835166
MSRTSQRKEELHESTPQWSDHNICSAGSNSGNQCNLRKRLSEHSYTGIDSHIKEPVAKVAKEAKNPSEQEEEEALRGTETQKASVGYVGLRNQGATCYLNTVLQTLFMTEDFRKAVESLKTPTESSVSYELQQLFMELKAGNRNASTSGIIRTLHIKNEHEQQDAAVYLQKILKSITPKMSKMFQGEETHRTACLGNCKNKWNEMVPFFSIPISLKADLHNVIDVKSCFDAHFNVEVMDGENQLYCHICKEDADHEIRCELSEFPEILVLHLKRFYLDYTIMTYRKKDCPVNIPFLLIKQGHTYDLYAVVNHTGSLRGGHYYVSIKSFEDGLWYEFNDSTVDLWQPEIVRIISPSPHQTISVSENPEKIFTSDSACLLLYKKKMEEERDEKETERMEGEIERKEEEERDEKETENMEGEIERKEEEERDEKETENIEGEIEKKEEEERDEKETERMEGEIERKEEEERDEKETENMEGEIERKEEEERDEKETERMEGEIEKKEEEERDEKETERMEGEIERKEEEERDEKETERMEGEIERKEEEERDEKETERMEGEIERKEEEERDEKETENMEGEIERKEEEERDEKETERMEGEIERKEEEERDEKETEKMEGEIERKEEWERDEKETERMEGEIERKEEEERDEKETENMEGKIERKEEEERDEKETERMEGEIERKEEEERDEKETERMEGEIERKEEEERDEKETERMEGEIERKEEEERERRDIKMVHEKTKNMEAVVNIDDKIEERKREESEALLREEGEEARVMVEMGMKMPISRSTQRKKRHLILAVWTVVGAIVGALVGALIGFFAWPAGATVEGKIVTACVGLVVGASIGGIVGASIGGIVAKHTVKKEEKR